MALEKLASPARTSIAAANLDRRSRNLPFFLLLDLGLLRDDAGQPVPELLNVGRLPLQPGVWQWQLWPASFQSAARLLQNVSPDVVACMRTDGGQQQCRDLERQETLHANTTSLFLLCFYLLASSLCLCYFQPLPTRVSSFIYLTPSMTYLKQCMLQFSNPSADKA